MDKDKFKELFKQAMSCKEIYCCGLDEDSEIVSTKHDEEPKLIIRDFEGDSGFDDNGVYYQEIPDREFTDFEKAWDYFKDLSTVRIMDVSGQILYDNLVNEDEATKSTGQKDVVDSIEMVESQSYASRKGKTYELIGSKSADWESAYIKGYVFEDGKGDVPIYHIGSITKTPFPHKVIIDGVTKDAMGTSITVNDDGHLYKHQETQHTTKGIVGLSTDRCELCGHPIKYQHILINHKDKRYMVVGSECVHHSQGAVDRKAIKKFKDNEIRQEFTEIRPQAIALLDTKKDLSSDWAKRSGRIVYWAYKMKEELTKIEPEKTGSRKLKNRIETMKKLIAEEKGGDLSLTPSQKKQIKFCEDAVSTESSYKLRTYHIDCKDCDESKSFHSAMTCVDFISRHTGHDTWIDTERGQDTLTLEKEKVVN